MKNLLLIDSGDGAKSFIFNLISNDDIRLFLAVPHPQEWMLQVTDARNIITCDVYTQSAITGAVQQFEQENNVTFDGIGTYFDFFVIQAATLADERDLPQISIDAAKRSSANKFTMRQTCAAAGVLMPRYELVRNAEETNLLESITNFGFPCVVKPIVGSKSFGVKKFESAVTEADLQELFDLTNEHEKELFKNFTGDFLIEEYMPGTVVSVDGFIQDNTVSIAGVIEFVMGPEPHFTQEANYIPARLTDDITTQCIAYTKQVIAALGFDMCGFHCELRITADGPRLIEIACRLPGGPLQLGYQQAYDYNLAKNLVDIWLGKSTKLAGDKKQFVAQKAIYDYRHGTLTSIAGLSEVERHPAVWASAQITPTGGAIKTYPEVPNPIYFYAAESDSHGKLAKLERDIEDLVEYSIE